jgi:carboxyl-terminal processing protease
VVAASRRLAIFPLLSLLAAVALPATAQPAPDESLPLAVRVEAATHVYSDVQTYFAHWAGVPDLDLDAEYRSYVAAIVANDSRKAFDLASMRFMAKLQNGHTGFFDPWLLKTFGQRLNFYARPIGAEWVVVRSHIDGLKVGDVIVRIDGEPFGAFYQRNKDYVSASSEAWRARSFLEYPFLFPPRFRLDLLDGRQVEVSRTGEFKFPGPDRDSDDVTLADGILTIRVPGFDDPHFEDQAVAALEANRSARAIIIDVRGNHGGATPLKLVEKLMGKPFEWWGEETPVHLGSAELDENRGVRHVLRTWGVKTTPDEKNPSNAPVFVLIDGGCFSACEDFAMLLKINHRGTLIGERSAGSSGQPYQGALASGMGYAIGAKRMTAPDGARFEGVGIEPDLEVASSRADLIAGRDPAMLRARSLAQNAKQPH